VFLFSADSLIKNETAVTPGSASAATSKSSTPPSAPIKSPSSPVSGQTFGFDFIPKLPAC
jgi:hypothetical protein